jgi:signal transduction histidine kinase
VVAVVVVVRLVDDDRAVHQDVGVRAVRPRQDVGREHRLSALVDACREAMTNAAKHSGAECIAVYLEVESDMVTAFVRDQGMGFDLDGVGRDRRGIADSIVGRMRRAGGFAVVSTDPGHGTEVRLSIRNHASSAAVMMNGIQVKQASMSANR